MEILQGKLTRQEKLKIWLDRNNVSITEIAGMLDVAKSSAYYWLFARDSISSIRHNQLTDLGIPARLLPPAKDKFPGRKKNPGKR